MKVKTKKTKISKKKQLKNLEDEAAIRALVARFTDALIVSDVEEFKTLWVKEGNWIIQHPNSQSSEGIGNISEMFIALKKQSDFIVQFAQSGVIKIDGDKATARWVVHEVSKGAGKTYHQNYGLYIDVMKKSKGKWRFVQRDYHFLWVNDLPFSGDLFTLPADIGTK